MGEAEAGDAGDSSDGGGSKSGLQTGRAQAVLLDARRRDVNNLSLKEA